MRRRIAAPQLLLGMLAVVVAAALAAQLLTWGSRWWRANESTGRPTSSESASAGSLRTLTAHEAGEAFLSGYVESDGRVTRRDEGGDTVSEGQAYAMLVAAALNDQQHFTTIRAWTKQNLARKDGLLAWRWEDGQVIDNASASDADLDAARALVIAAAAFGDDKLKAEGVRLGTAVLDKETVMTQVGRVLVSGSWANDSPYAYNPSYTSPAANALLADATGDKRWAELDSGTRAVTTALLNSADLPPDWAQVHPDGRIDAMPGAAGRGDEGVRYGYDATRMPIRFAESCHPADVALAARLTPALDQFVGDPAARDLGGAPSAQRGVRRRGGSQSCRTGCRWPNCSRHLSAGERRPPPAGETDVLRCCLECAGAAHAERGDLGWMSTSGWRDLRTSLSACATRHATRCSWATCVSQLMRNPADLGNDSLPDAVAEHARNDALRSDIFDGFDRRLLPRRFPNT